MPVPDESNVATSSEAIIGEIPVVTRLAMGSERLRLFLTSGRLILAHVGKRGAGALAMTAFLGKLSGLLEDLFKRSRESLKTRKVDSSSPDRILGFDKDNFYINYSEIISVKLEPLPQGAFIEVLSKNDKLEFWTSMEFEPVTALFRDVLGEKVRIMG